MKPGRRDIQLPTQFNKRVDTLKFTRHNEVGPFWLATAIKNLPRGKSQFPGLNPNHSAEKDRASSPFIHSSRRFAVSGPFAAGLCGYVAFGAYR